MCLYVFMVCVSVACFVLGQLLCFVLWLSFGGCLLFVCVFLCVYSVLVVGLGSVFLVW